MFKSKKKSQDLLTWPKPRKKSRKRKLARVGLGGAGIALLVSLFTKKGNTP